MQAICPECHGDPKCMVCHEAKIDAEFAKAWPGGSTTPTGIPIIDCTECGQRHPETRTHCEVCGMATLFGHDFCFPKDAA